jgi:methyl-accepting chemotaxis protein
MDKPMPWPMTWLKRGRTGATQASATGRRTAVHEYFRYHGVFAPGVRLMRALSVRGKAMLLAVTFLVPLAVMLNHVLELPLHIEEDLAWALLGVALALLLAAYALVAFYRVIDGGLAQLRDQVSRMASGDLSAPRKPWGRDEVAHAMYSLGTSLARLADLFAAVRAGVSGVSHAAREIAGANQDLTQRTRTSAQVIEGVVRGVGQYVEQLDACGQRIDEAEAVVQRMRLDAAHARHQMHKLDERMQALSRRSREIGEIVELIDQLSFRTNILALNASIEAAKAGESGRGFAVVAQEVRSLAKRSTESARRIGDIVGRSTDDIAQGNALAGEAAAALQTTDIQVTRIHEEMQQIVALTRAGQQSSQDILTELRGLSDLTQDNQRLVEQMARASTSLSAEGERLDEKVDTFKLT